MISNQLRNQLESAFTPPQIEALADLFEAHMRSLVKASDFNELKEIVRDLAEAQQRTEAKVEELAEAQRRTEEKVENLAGTVQTLAEAQRRTEEKVENLAGTVQTLSGTVQTLSGTVQGLVGTVQDLVQSQARMLQAQTEMQMAITQLSRGLDEVRGIAGANAQTLGYMLENEAYRNLPAWLKQHRGIEVVGRMIRLQVGDEEINLLVDAKSGAEEFLIVGEAKSRLHLSDLGLMAMKVEEVKEQYAGLQGRRIQPLIVAHFAPEKIRQRAEQDGIIIVQSFEW
jgi:chromosome segregation ATPase